MLSIKAIREKIAEKKAEAESIIGLAESEERELSGEESTAFNAIAGVGKEGDENFVAGEIAALESQLAQAEKRDDLKRKVLAERVQEGNVDLPEVEDSARFENVRIHASAHRPAKINGFSGDHATKQAYASGMFVAAIFGNEKAMEFCKEQNIITNKMMEGTDSLGGYLVPEPLEEAIIRIVEDFGLMRRLAFRKPMTSKTDKVGRRIGGLKVFYPGEGNTLTLSDLRLDKVALDAIKYACLGEITTELNEDSVIEMVSLLTMEMGLAISKAEDTNGLLGDGTAAFASVTGLHAAINAVVGKPSQVVASAIALDSLQLPDFEQCEATLPDFSGIDPVWICNKKVWGSSMAPLARTAGGTTAEHITGTKARKEFLGYEVHFSQVMPRTPAANEPIAFFGDPRMAITMGVRRGMSFATSTEGKFFLDDTVGVKGTTRTAIKCHEVGQAALAADGDQPAVEELAGPILSLVAPAS